MRSVSVHTRFFSIHVALLGAGEESLEIYSTRFVVFPGKFDERGARDWPSQPMPS